MTLTVLGAFVTALSLSPPAGEPPPPPPKIETGKPAPDFSLKDQEGKSVKVSDFRKKKNVLLAFYPKDFTGG